MVISFKVDLKVSFEINFEVKFKANFEGNFGYKFWEITRDSLVVNEGKNLVDNFMKNFEGVCKQFRRQFWEQSIRYKAGNFLKDNFVLIFGFNFGDTLTENVKDNFGYNFLFNFVVRLSGFCQEVFSS